MSSETTGIFEVVQNIEQGGIMLIGEQPLPSSAEEVATAEIKDLQVQNAKHAVADGFEKDEVLPLGTLANDLPAMVIPEDDEVTVILTRGPDSKEPGSPALIAGEDSNDPTARYIVAGFAFYRLPADAQRTLARNIAAWLLNE
jgi:hypothetical protein